MERVYREVVVIYSRHSDNVWGIDVGNLLKRESRWPGSPARELPHIRANSSECCEERQELCPVVRPNVSVDVMLSAGCPEVGPNVRSVPNAERWVPRSRAQRQICT
jgi:hypothetical protein